MGLIFDSQEQLEDVLEELMNKMFKEENIEKLKEKKCGDRVSDQGSRLQDYA